MIIKPRPFRDRFILPDKQRGFLLNPARFAVGGSAGYAATVIADGPLGYWKLDETSGTVAADSSGNSRNGTIGSSVVKNSGVALRRGGNSMTFAAAANNAINIPDSAAIRLSSTTTFSLEAWIKHTGTGGAGLQGILTKWNNESNGWIDYGLYLNPGTTVGAVGRYTTSGSNSFTVGSANTSLSTIYHLVYVRNGSTNIIYLNGAQSATNTTGSTSTYGGLTAPLYIGSDPAFPGSYGYAGQISDVAIYNKVLTASQVLAHYNAGL